MSETIDIRRLAGLAKLRLTEEETARLEREMPQIIAFARQLEQLDLDGVPPMANASDGAQALRVDEVRPSLEAGAVLRAAPATQGTFIVVPRTVE